MDTNKLRYYIADRKKSLSEFGNALCISHSALHRKMKGETEFTRKEIQTTITFLNLSCNEVMDIFFLHKKSPKGDERIKNVNEDL